jgi:hypothetical protein
MKNIVRGFGLALVAALAIACGGVQYDVHGAERASGADGHIEIEAQDGGNHLVNVEVENLLPPSRFGDGLTVYVVWFQAPEQQPRRAGTLAYEEGDRAGQMTATTTDGTFELIVTGETAADTVSPSENVVFRVAVDAQ